MNILVLFYIVFLSRLCSSADSRDGGNNGSTGTLVSKLDGSKYNVSASNSNGVPVLQCKPRSGVLANELKYGGETIWDGKGKVQVLLALIYFKGDKPEVVTLQCKENDKNPTLFLHKDGSKWVDCKEEHERKLKGLQNAAKSEESDEEEDATNDGQDDVPAYTAEEIEEFKKHLIKLASKVDKTVVKVDGVTEDNLFALKLTPKDEKAVTKVKYDDKEVWSGGGLFSKSNLVEAIIYFYKEIPALVNIKVVKGGKESTVYRYYDARGFWCDSEEEQFNNFLEGTKKQVEKLKAKEAEKAAKQEPNTLDIANPDSQPSNEQEDVKDVSKSSAKPTPEEPKKEQDEEDEVKEEEAEEPDQPSQEQPPAKPVTLSERAKKVDAKLFDVRESSSNGVFYLTCTPKDKKNPTKLVYGSETIWSGNKSVLFLSALIYFKGDQPYIVTLSKKENGKEDILFLHYDGKKWVENKTIHATKLNELRDASKPEDVPEAAKKKQDVTPSQKAPVQTNTQPAEHTTKGNANKEQDGKQVQAKEQTTVQPQNPLETTEQESIKSELTSPFLDKVDTSLFDIEEAEEDTVKVLKLKEKDGVKATEVNYDGQRILSGWKLGSCPSALLYMDQDRPTLAVVDFQCNGNVTKVYRYHDGKQWKDGNESNHKKKLELLKEKYKPNEEASIEALLDLPEHIPEHPQEFEDEDEDPSFNDDDDWDGPLSQEQEEDDDPDLEPEPERRPRKSRNSTRRESNAYKSRGSSEKLPEDEDSELNDGFWDTPDDYSERQGDTQDEPDGLVIEDEEDGEEEAEDDEVEDIGEEEEDEKEEVEEPENSSGSPLADVLNTSMKTIM
ncbi:conserved hypothetical protein [Theileria equi strain WA]|uniref:Signal peptide containing protein n=1 Tax=Theileria equi strain WA TaxID=1537102 RepID=L1LBQ3_THEEQ|nr:conserved hypothetical protein [Theileria equi strain WA]EKX72608.1 conserved hypothetical protein [Theileria equi strain WA]|eukprot:XP_004832060.1 conserved hypothetical protein [Theileria equi strain WA]